MGCAQSKNARREGLFTQQEQLVGNNNKVCHTPKNEPAQPTTSTMPSTRQSPPDPPTPSRHSPPASRPSSQHLPILEGMGSLSEVWRMPTQWDKFKQYLATLKEDEDSDGKPLTMERYAIFLELYAMLDQEYNNGTDKERLAKIVDEIAKHEEEFFGRERFLRCLDSATRKEILNNIKQVKAGEEKPGPLVFILIYPKIVDKLGELLGSYQNMVLEEEGKNKEKR